MKTLKILPVAKQSMWSSCMVMDLCGEGLWIWV